jgi:helicase
MPKKSLDIEDESSIESVNLALDTIKLGKQALVFVNTRPSAEKTAEEISKKIKEASPVLEELSQKVLKALSRPTKQCERLAFCIRKGIAFHHSGLVAKQREIVEDNFRSGAVKIICCTPSLAMGVDLPAFRAIIRDLRRYTAGGLDWIPVLEYLQFAGRAGRPKFDTEGQAVCIAGSEAEKKEIYERYILGEPEDIQSKLAVEPALRTYVLSLIASGFVRTKKELLEFFEKTFWAFQFGDMQRLGAIIEKILGMLDEWEFIKSSAPKSDFISADEIEADEKLLATAMGKRVSELYLDPLTAFEIITGLRRAVHYGLSTFAMLHLLCSALEMRPLLRTKVKEQDLIEEKTVEHHGKLLAREPSVFEAEYEDYLNAVKTAMFFEEWINEMDEEYLLEKYAIRPGETRTKLVTADWLLYGAAEIARLLEFREMTKDIVKLRLRVADGVREELLPLLKFRGIGRVRARRLYNNKIRDIGDVKTANAATLTQILGSGKVALDLKAQVGEKIEVVPKGTRKGQTSIERY